ncbi:MAG: SUMF1/EgtB/PvdO family nonheme iron enzyme [Saprospiraceae bacterium]
MKRKAFQWSVTTLFILILFACGGGNKQSGYLTGVQNRPKWKGINPYGMVYVPSGTLNVGQSDQDIFSSYVQKPKAISISGFYIDDTEITNNEYRQFVEYIKDSLAHTLMGDVIENDDGSTSIDWDIPIDWTAEELKELYYQGEDRLDGDEIDERKLIYTYSWFDIRAAAQAPKNTPRKTFVKKASVPVAPDNLVWIRDFAYSYNDPMAKNYNSHPAYDDYPVVGVNWDMAKAFSDWRTKTWNKFRPDEVNSEGFRLPTEYEWEYAARGKKELAPYPWGGYYIRNAKGCLLANFKPGRGNYPEDGGQYTVEVHSYFPNEYGIYNMSGNVAEWTVTAYFDNANNFTHDMNPDIQYDAKPGDPTVYKRKVIRGGSWKDISYYLQNGTRTYEYQDSTKSYIGFRNVLSFLGRSINDFK